MSIVVESKLETNLNIYIVISCIGIVRCIPYSFKYAKQPYLVDGLASDVLAGFWGLSGL